MANGLSLTIGGGNGQSTSQPSDKFLESLIPFIPAAVDVVTGFFNGDDDEEEIPRTDAGSGPGGASTLGDIFNQVLGGVTGGGVGTLALGGILGAALSGLFGEDPEEITAEDLEALNPFFAFLESLSGQFGTEEAELIGGLKEPAGITDLTRQGFDFGALALPAFSQFQAQNPLQPFADLAFQNAVTGISPARVREFMSVPVDQPSGLQLAFPTLPTQTAAPTIGPTVDQLTLGGIPVSSSILGSISNILNPLAATTEGGSNGTEGGTEPAPPETVESAATGGRRTAGGGTPSRTLILRR